MLRLGEIARIVGGDLDGPADKEITGAAPIADAGPTEISFVAERRYFEAARSSRAGCVIVGRDAPPLDLPVIQVADPRLAFAQVLEALQPPRDVPMGIHPTAVIGEGAQIGADVSIQAHVVVGKNAVIGDGVLIYPGCYVGNDSVIGAGSVLYPNVTVYEGVTIGQSVILHAGAVIGSDGYGYVAHGGRHRKVPQIGTVIIEDDVEIGANTTVDRGTCGATIIRRGTKIDNLVQVAHNVDVGEDSLIVAQSGIAGSVTLGARVTMAGQTGAAGHLTIGRESVVAARGFVTRTLPPGSFVSGFPARGHKEQMRVLAASQKLPDLLDTVAHLKRTLDEIEARIEALEEEHPAAGDR